jgi:glucosamine--fructose-6-phosphate aminotransferase (isomerizing)
MCGIVGYIGTEDVKETILNGLERLEYRGYDSAGIALFDGEEVKVFREDSSSKRNN